MEKVLTNYAYIDGANLHKGVAELGWPLSYSRFRVWLADKYKVGRAYLFIGLVPKYKDLYTFLQEAGFTLVFKETTYDGEGKIKGNCDSDLVLRAAQDFYEGNFENAIIVASDGDYASLVKFLKEKGKLRAILSPSPSKKCSILLKRINAPIVYLNDVRARIQVQNEKAPGQDRT